MVRRLEVERALNHGSEDFACWLRSVPRSSLTNFEEMA